VIEAQMNRPLSDRERLALGWLRDENLIQRNVEAKLSGKVVATELDVSGGLNALIDLLRGGNSLHQQLRLALAIALEPLGASMLQLQKRPRRTRGAPAKGDSVRGAVIDAFEAVVVPKEVGDEIERLIKRQPQPAVGENARPKPAVIEQAIRNVGAKRKIGRTKIEELIKRASGGVKD
jgi:hypothetical protein